MIYMIYCIILYSRSYDKKRVGSKEMGREFYLKQNSQRNPMQQGNI